MIARAFRMFIDATVIAVSLWALLRVLAAGAVAMLPGTL